MANPRLNSENNALDNDSRLGSSGISVAEAERRESSRTDGSLVDRAKASQRRGHSSTEQKTLTGMYVVSMSNPPPAVVMH